jgi:hypothetical protein
VASVRKRTIPTKRPKLVPTLADRGCRMVSVTDPYSRILGFIDWSQVIILFIITAGRISNPSKLLIQEDLILGRICEI